MLTHEIEALERRGKPAPLLDDMRSRWLWELFQSFGQSGRVSWRFVAALLTLSGMLYVTPHR